MELSKEQTLQLYYNADKQNAFKYKFKFSTKYKWYCLGCLTPLYITYRQYGRNCIFCHDCYIKNFHYQSVVQVQYMRILKERQLKLVEKFCKSKIEIDRESLYTI